MCNTKALRERTGVTLTGYNELVQTLDNEGGKILNTQSKTERKDMVLDGFGRLASYKENFTPSSYDAASGRVWLNSDLSVYREVSTVSYDLRNQLVG